MASLLEQYLFMLIILLLFNSKTWDPKLVESSKPIDIITFISGIFEEWSTVHHELSTEFLTTKCILLKKVPDYFRPHFFSRRWKCPSNDLYISSVSRSWWKTITDKVERFIDASCSWIQTYIGGDIRIAGDDDTLKMSVSPIVPTTANSFETPLFFIERCENIFIVVLTPSVWIAERLRIPNIIKSLLVLPRWIFYSVTSVFSSLTVRLDYFMLALRSRCVSDTLACLFPFMAVLFFPLLAWIFVWEESRKKNRNGLPTTEAENVIHVAKVTKVSRASPPNFIPLKRKPDKGVHWFHRQKKKSLPMTEAGEDLDLAKGRKVRRSSLSNFKYQDDDDASENDIMLAQPIRLLLAYTESKYEDKKYNYGPAPDFDRSAWFKEKFTLGLDFPNLPYFIDGDVKLTQSLVIMRYLARKHKLDAETEAERIRVDIVEQQVVDLRMGMIRLCYNPDFEKVKDDYLKTLPAQLKQFSEFLGERKYFAGDKLTYVDFLAYEALDQHRILSPDCLNDFQNLKEFLGRFENLPTVQKYMKSEDYMKWPLNGDMAKFGARGSKA